jgi:hypothetical protein
MAMHYLEMIETGMLLTIGGMLVWGAFKAGWRSQRAISVRYIKWRNKRRMTRHLR